MSVFEDGVEVLADTMGVELDDVQCHVDFAAAVHDLDLPGRPIAAGTVAGLDLRFVGIVDGVEVLELHQRWVMSRELEPPMPVEHGYKIEVDGSPQITLTLGHHARPATRDPHRRGHARHRHDHHRHARRPRHPGSRRSPSGIVTYADIPVPASPLTSEPGRRARPRVDADLGAAIEGLTTTE